MEINYKFVDMKKLTSILFLFITSLAIGQTVLEPKINAQLINGKPLDSLVRTSAVTQTILGVKDFTGTLKYNGSEVITTVITAATIFQGLSWDSSTDTYSRLGSLVGIATSLSAGNENLPIQSDMRRCLLNDDGTVNYYLNDTLSAMIAEMTIPYSDSINYAMGDTIIVTGATFEITADTGMWVYNVDSSLYAEIISIISNDTLILSDSIFVMGDSINQYNAILNGNAGQIMVEIPKFYYKHTLAGTLNTWMVSKYDLPGFELHPAFWKDGHEVNYRYYSAFEGSMYDASAAAMTAKASIATSLYAAGDKMCSVAGQWAKTNETRQEYRPMAAARGAGWRQLDYYLNSAVQLLYLVEFADFNSQTMIGAGRTALSGGTWVADSYIGLTGLSVGNGNGTASVSNGTTIGYLTDYMAYRGIENFFGNVWKMVDGIAWDGRWVDQSTPQPVYVTNNSTYFADQTGVNMKHLVDATNIGDGLAGYTSNIENVIGFIPSAIGASSTTKITDYYYQYSEVGRDYWRVFLFGGASASSVTAGGFGVYASDPWSGSGVSIAGRLCF